jgi:hypothetical protein
MLTLINSAQLHAKFRQTRLLSYASLLFQMGVSSSRMQGTKMECATQIQGTKMECATQM